MPTILIVDDEERVCHMLSEFLSRKGYEVCTALSGEEALRLVEQRPPDLILLDVKMPGLDGLQTLARIKAIAPDTGVIMVTALQDEETGKQAMQLGAADYITKPFSLEYLETSVAVKILMMTT